ncbi:protein kinase [bacterium]|nr:protein kinase [bacterium]
MTRPHRQPEQQGHRTVRVDGRTYPVIDEFRAAGRTWPVLEILADGPRRQLKVFDRFAGRRGGLRSLYLLPVSQASWQHIEILRRVSATSSHLPVILECRREGEWIVLVVTWIHGATLREYLDAVRAGKHPASSPTESVRLVRGLAHALAQLYRHQQIVHGDLRPDNLILARRPTRLVLIDFGSTWMIEAAARSHPTDGCVPAYAAPEAQPAAGLEHRDFRSDQFSTGVILFELLTGQIPYGGVGGRVLQFADADTARQQWKPASQLAIDRRRIPGLIWKAIDAHLCQALALKPDDRFPTPAAWLDSLDAVQLCITQSSHVVDRSAVMTGVIDWLADCLKSFPPWSSTDRRRGDE